jgi:hypothetical protein
MRQLLPIHPPPFPGAGGAEEGEPAAARGEQSIHSPEWEWSEYAAQVCAGTEPPTPFPLPSSPASPRLHPPPDPHPRSHACLCGWAAQVRQSDPFLKSKKEASTRPPRIAPHADARAQRGKLAEPSGARGDVCTAASRPWDAARRPSRRHERAGRGAGLEGWPFAVDGRARVAPAFRMRHDEAGGRRAEGGGSSRKGTLGQPRC